MTMESIKDSGSRRDTKLLVAHYIALRSAPVSARYDSEQARLNMVQLGLVQVVLQAFLNFITREYGRKTASSMSGVTWTLEKLLRIHCNALIIYHTNQSSTTNHQEFLISRSSGAIGSVLGFDG